MNITKEQLIAFERSIADEFEAGKLPYPIHYSGGNEEQLLKFFEVFKIGPADWVFSTWRSHYHYLLKGGDPEKLRLMIRQGRSMHIMDRELKFFASSIVAGCCPIAVGVAEAIIREKLDGHVYCFIGDGAEDEGVFYESVRYARAWLLPLSFIIEDNGLSVDTTKEERILDYCLSWPGNVRRYEYKRQWPHVQTGRFVKEYM